MDQHLLAGRKPAALLATRSCIAVAAGSPLVAPTAADARDVTVEGESGLLANGPPSQRPQYEPTKRRLTWPNGAIATTYSADEPERLRGPQHDAAWCDEIAAWRYVFSGLSAGEYSSPTPTPVNGAYYPANAEGRQVLSGRPLWRMRKALRNHLEGRLGF